MQVDPVSRLSRVQVSASTDVYGLNNYETIVGQLVPGASYTAVAIYERWVHILDEISRLEGWGRQASCDRAVDRPAMSDPVVGPSYRSVL